MGSGPLKTGPLGLVRERDCEGDGWSWRVAVGRLANWATEVRPRRLGKEVRWRQVGAGVEGL